MEVSTNIKKTGLKGLMVNRDYSLLLWANFISRFGDSLDGVAYGWMVYMLTGSKLLLGTLMAINAMPNILVGPFAGVLADRVNKKKLISLSFLARGILVTFTGVLFFFGLLRPWHLFGFTILISTFETLMSPAATSMMPLLLDKEEYLAANSFSSSAYRFAELIGTGVAGVVIAFLGISGAIIIDGVTFFIAAFLITLLRVKMPKVEVKEFGAKAYLKELKVGFNFVKENKLVRLVMMLFAIVNFCLSPIGILLPVFAKDILKGGPETLSAIGISISLGTIVGGLVIAQYGKKLKLTTLIILGFTLLGFNYALLSLPGTVVTGKFYAVALTCAIFFVLGFLIPLVSSPISSYLMTNTDPKILGRVSSFLGMISMCAMPLGSAVTGIVSEFIPISLLFLAMGTMITLVALSLTKSKTFKNA